MADEITSFAKQRREDRQLQEAVASSDKQLQKTKEQLIDLQAKHSFGAYLRNFE